MQKFSEWGAYVLPNIFPHWNDLSQDIKDELITINDVYCGKHLILNLQEYASTAVNEWEKAYTMGQFISMVINNKALVIYSVIHKIVFIPLWDFPTQIIEAVNHSSNSTRHLRKKKKNYG